MCEMGEGRSSLMAAGRPAQISGKIGLLAALRGEVLPRLVGKSGQLVVGIFAMISLLDGCTTAQVHDVGEASGGIRPREAIAILTVTDSPLEGEAVGCISEAVRTAHPKARIIPPDEFRRTVFAARPPDDEAERAKYLTSLANEPAIRDRMDSLGIRFLMSVGGGTEKRGGRPGPPSLCPHCIVGAASSIHSGGVNSRSQPSAAGGGTPRGGVRASLVCPHLHPPPRGPGFHRGPGLQGYWRGGRTLPQGRDYARAGRADRAAESITEDSMSRGAKRLWNADRARLTRAGRERMAVRAVVGIAMVCFLSGCGPFHHTLEVTVAPQLSVTPINLGSGAKVSLLILDDRPTKNLRDDWTTTWVQNDTHWTVSALGDLTAALAEPLRSGLMTLGFEVVPTPGASPVALEIHLLSLASNFRGSTGGSYVDCANVVAHARAEVRRGQTQLFQRRYSATSRYTHWCTFTRRWTEEKINTELSNLIGKILADLELLAALK